MDTGALYRAVGLSALDRATSLDDGPALAALAAALDLSLLEDPRLRHAATADAASRISALPAVRGALLALQRSFAAQPGGAVLDGRDIGTVIAPHAPAKLFVTASPQVRAARRHAELPGSDLDAVLADILARDARDSGRADAPLKQAPDADLLDTSEMTIDGAVQRAIHLVQSRTA